MDNQPPENDRDDTPSQAGGAGGGAGGQGGVVGGGQGGGVGPASAQGEAAPGLDAVTPLPGHTYVLTATPGELIDVDTGEILACSGPEEAQAVVDGAAAGTGWKLEGVVDVEPGPISPNEMVEAPGGRIELLAPAAPAVSPDQGEKPKQKRKVGRPRKKPGAPKVKHGKKIKTQAEWDAAMEAKRRAPKGPYSEERKEAMTKGQRKRARLELAAKAIEAAEEAGLLDVSGPVRVEDLDLENMASELSGDATRLRKRKARRLRRAEKEAKERPLKAKSAARKASGRARKVKKARTKGEQRLRRAQEAREDAASAEKRRNVAAAQDGVTHGERGAGWVPGDHVPASAPALAAGPEAVEGGDLGLEKSQGAESHTTEGKSDFSSSNTLTGQGVSGNVERVEEPETVENDQNTEFEAENARARADAALAGDPPPSVADSDGDSDRNSDPDGLGDGVDYDTADESADAGGDFDDAVVGEGADGAGDNFDEVFAAEDDPGGPGGAGGGRKRGDGKLDGRLNRGIGGKVDQDLMTEYLEDAEAEEKAAEEAERDCRYELGFNAPAVSKGEEKELEEIWDRREKRKDWWADRKKGKAGSPLLDGSRVREAPGKPEE